MVVEISTRIGAFLRRVQYAGSFFLDPTWDERDDVSSVLNEMAEAGLIFLSKPIHSFFISSLLKTFWRGFVLFPTSLNLRVLFLESFFFVIMVEN